MPVGPVVEPDVPPFGAADYQELAKPTPQIANRNRTVDVLLVPIPILFFVLLLDWKRPVDGFGVPLVRVRKWRRKVAN